MLHARRDVVDIWDQPPPITYRDANGCPREHTFDFRVTLDDGQRIAIAVKPEALAQRQRFRETLRLIRAATPLSYARDVVLVTERSYTPADARNAQKLHDFRRTPDPVADTAIAALIDGLTGATTLAELVDASGLKGRGFRASFRAIFSGLLRSVDGGDILPSSVVTAEVAQ
ncbi:TnsA endonuclease N-terminal domain-containing protein [Pseudoruegeria sp. SK021]|uniref:TnsA endonuclease N-terminal domain-containing protein n=1 Tax=Pseudoruegeria sp. SK021 TaxID=1933035 RepID=UPI000A24EB1C|nr:TnsA endonuclease N-terminal domain-containing protein [Pseudoruegeria sp. SK021]OSP54463.1 hypothetical protein BV911_12765 [Pseudoruegeria sp. SK021]